MQLRLAAADLSRALQALLRQQQERQQQQQQQHGGGHAATAASLSESAAGQQASVSEAELESGEGLLLFHLAQTYRHTVGLYSSHDRTSRYSEYPVSYLPA